MDLRSYNLITERLVNCYAQKTSQLFRRRKRRRFCIFKLSDFHNSAVTLKWQIGTKYGKNDSQVGSPPLAGTRETLGGHLNFIWDTPESLVFHPNYTCHSPVPFSFTRLTLVSVQWMLYNWIIRAWKPASSKHSSVLWFSAKALPCLVTSMSLEKPLSPLPVSMKTLIVHC